MSKNLSDTIKELYKDIDLDSESSIELKQIIKNSINEIEKRPKAV